MILVTGGAGYIGSHAVKELLKAHKRVVVLDNLSYGHRLAVPAGAELVEGDLQDNSLVTEVFRRYPFRLVMHFAAHSIVSQSVKFPLLSYRNISGTLNLLGAMLDAGVDKLVFSSTAAVYGQPQQIPIVEDHPLNPINPYGRSKAWLEEILAELHQAYGLHYVSLRYFNAAGASLEGDLGEDHRPETHLIPLIMQAALGRKKHLQVYGQDYPTADGTPVRDYIHVVDLIQAHLLAAEALLNGRLKRGIYNLGNEKGYTVLEVLETAARVTGKKIPYIITERRPGDPAVLVADSEKIKKELGWSPRYADLEIIVRSAWEWHRRHPDGYAES